MISLLDKFRIPTILGLSIIILGLVASVYLTLQNQILDSQASPDITPKNIQLSNIEDTSLTISWQTIAKTTGYLKFGQGASPDQTVLDVRDKNTLISRTNHLVTIQNLIPSTNYTYRVVSGKTLSAPMQFTTAPENQQNGLKPIIGSVLNQDQALTEGLVFLTIPGVVLQSSVIKDFGNFVIPINKARLQDLSKVFLLSKETEARLTVTDEAGHQAEATFNLNQEKDLVAPLKIGFNLDLTIQPASPSAKAIFDLNSDGFINTADYALVIQNFGLKDKKLKNKKADLNNDGQVNQTDLNLISREIYKPVNQ